MSPELERFAGNRIRRRLIIETILAAKQPFSARDLCEMVKNRNPAVSRTTVYRTLRLLRERQFVRMTALQGGNRVFHLDRSRFFWVCDDCSRIRTFSSHEVTESLRLFAEHKGFHSVEITVEVHSRCGELLGKGFCSQRNPGKNKKDILCRARRSAWRRSEQAEGLSQLTLSSSDDLKCKAYE